jgi:hypothetical protein
VLESLPNPHPNKKALTGKRCACCTLLNAKLKFVQLQDHFAATKCTGMTMISKAKMTKTFINSTTLYCPQCSGQESSSQQTTKPVTVKPIMICSTCAAGQIWDHNTQALVAELSEMTAAETFEYLVGRPGKANTLVSENSKVNDKLFVAM